MVPRKNIRDDIIIIACIFGFFWFVVFLFQPQNIPSSWFPGPVAALAFKILFALWILMELINTIWSRKNSRRSDQDKGSYIVVVLSLYAGLFIILLCRIFQIGIISGVPQYIGLILTAIGIMLRQWAILVLGKHFTVRVQADGTSDLVTSGPYRFVRHPAYTGTLLTLAGLALALGTLPGAVLVVITSLTAYEYRIHVEENVLSGAYGAEFENYRKRTGKLFPKF